MSARVRPFLMFQGVQAEAAMNAVHDAFGLETSGIIEQGAG